MRCAFRHEELTRFETREIFAASILEKNVKVLGRGLPYVWAGHGPQPSQTGFPPRRSLLRISFKIQLYVNTVDTTYLDRGVCDDPVGKVTPPSGLPFGISRHRYVHFFVSVALS